jgi:hypothetical protein
MHKEEARELCRETCDALNRGDLEDVRRRLERDLAWRGLGREEALAIVGERLAQGYFPVAIVRLDVLPDRVVTAASGITSSAGGGRDGPSSS